MQFFPFIGLGLGIPPMNGMLCLVLSLTLMYGSIVIGTYIVLYEVLYNRWIGRIRREIRQQIDRLLINDPCGEQRKELWGDSGRRENSMILMGSIFIVASFALLVGAVQTTNPSFRPILAIGAPSLYTLWLLLIQLSTRLMMDAEFEIHLIAEGTEGPMAILQNFYGGRWGRPPIMWFRRGHWLFYVIVIIFASIFIIQLDP